jgi:tRNA/rRNA methyltransferase
MTPFDPGTGPIMVLVRPQMGENIGAAARAMWNFGLGRMRVVAPRDGWPNSRRRWRWPAGAGRVLDHAGLFPTSARRWPIATMCLPPRRGRAG